MSIKIVNKTKQTMEEAYQNREHEALQHVTELLQEYQLLLQNLADQAQTEKLLALLSAVKILVENYQMQDLLLDRHVQGRGGLVADQELGL